MFSRSAMAKMVSILRRFLPVFLLVPTMAYSQVYQWVDEQGRVNYGDSPPEGVNASSVNLPEGPSDEQVEQAQQELKEALELRESTDYQQVGAPASPKAHHQPLPEFACYTPIGEVLRGPTEEAYRPVTPTEVTPQQESGARAVLSRAKGSWRGSAIELMCSGNVDSPRSEHLYFDVQSQGEWRDGEGLLVLENKASGSRNRVNETRVSYIEIGDALYYFEAAGDGNQSMNRTIALRGNMAEGLYLDESSLAFMNKRRSYNVMRTEIRHLQVTGRTLEYTELYFHQNLLTGSRVWTVKR